MRINWIGTQATVKSSNVANLTCINVYPEIVQSQQGKTVVALYGTPGVRPVVTLSGVTGIRALYTDSRGRLFAVRGFTIHEVFQDGTSATIGTILTGSGPLAMTDNGLVLLIVDGLFGYTYTYATGVLAQILDPDFPGATHAAFLDGYFVCKSPAITQQFFWSDLYAATFDPLNVASAEGSPDVVVALLVVHREVWLFGRATTEIWYSTGVANQEFARLQGALLEYGCEAPKSPAIVGGAVCWLAQNQEGGHQVVQALGTNVTPISTHAVETALSTYARTDDAFGWGYQAEGHTFYWLSFPQAQVTWVYDLSTGLWHQRTWHDQIQGITMAHRATAHAFAHGRHYIGTGDSGIIYTLEDTAYTDNGVPIVREVTLPPVFDANRLSRLLHQRLQIDLETGVGLDGNVVPGTDPMVELSYSDDGGHTWTAGRPLPLGRLGQYRVRVQAHRLGSSRDRRYRLRWSDPVKTAIVSAYVDVELAA